MKRILCALLTSVPMLALSQTGTFMLEGKISTYNAPAKAYLIYSVKGRNVTDSVTLKNGIFEFKGSIGDPMRANVVLDKNGSGWTNLRRQRNVDVLSIYLEEGTIKLIGSDSVSNAKVIGSTVNDDNRKLQALLEPVIVKMNALNAEYAAASKEKQESPAFREELGKRYEALEAEQNLLIKEFIRENTASYVSLDALKSYGGYYPEPAEVEPLFLGLTASIRESEGGKDYHAVIEKAKVTALGAIAPDFTQKDTAGKPVKLSDFRGKYVLLDFWAAWCGPCRAENPNVVRNYNKYKDRNFTVLGVSLDRKGDKDKWLKAIQDDKLTWTQVSDLNYFNNAAALKYGIVAIPQNYLIDPAGRIIAKNLRDAELGKKLAEVFGAD